MKKIPIIIVPDNKAGVPFPHMTYVKSSQLEFEKVNRDIIDTHVDKMTTTIRKEGFMDVIKVFPSHRLNDEGLPMYKVAEAQHRGQGVGNILKNKGEDGYVPIAILHWKDIDDKDEVYGTITTLNTVGKGWDIFQHVKSNADMTHWKNNKLHKEILSNMKKFANPTLMTNGVVAQCYTFVYRGHHDLKEMDKARKFSLNPIQVVIKDTLLHRIPEMVTAIGYKKAGCQFQRRFINSCQHHPLTKDSKNLPEWIRFIDHAIQSTIIFSSNNPLPDGDDMFFPWWGTILSTFKQKDTSIAA